MYTHTKRCSLIPRPSTPPVFDDLQHAKMEGEGLGNPHLCDPWHNRHMSSRLISTVKSCARPILRCVLAMKLGQASSESFLPSV